MLKGKNILIGITGGIAAYKICELVRMYKRANANVKVVCTQNALNFVTPLTLQSLTQNEVAFEEFNIQKYLPEHISYADWADVFVLAPLTANTLAKIANGICDNLLTSIVTAFTKPIIIAPAMNVNMWNNSVVKENLEKLKSKGFIYIAPEKGYLACGTLGDGRLASLDKIFNKTVETITPQDKKFEGKKIIITAGGTIEELDPVRYISNYSSGKMGTAIADEAYKRGAEVVLITTKDIERPYKIIKVKSALDMQNAVEKEFSNCNYAIMAAAVADYRAKNIAQNKMKKTDDKSGLTIELVKNPDILKGICEKKTTQTVVGFCAESENLYENAQEKIRKKGCDYLVANDISRKDIGFGSDFNEVVIFDKNNNKQVINRCTKQEIAQKILETIYE